MFSNNSNLLMQLFSLVGKIEGKIKLQKVIFILQEKKLINFELDYKFAQYGPYSESLQIELEYLSKIGFLKETSTPSSYTYELNEEFPISINVNQEFSNNKDLIFSLIQQESQLLEVTSTIYYLKARRYKENKSIESKIRILKPNLEDRITNAFQYYSVLES
jgi:uncharacterized protein YwgA